MPLFLRRNSNPKSKSINCSNNKELGLSKQQQQQQQQIAVNQLIPSKQKLFTIISITIIIIIIVTTTVQGRNYNMFLFSKKSAAKATVNTVMQQQQQQQQQVSLSATNSNYDKIKIQKKLRIALWSFFAGDALSSPTHWFYGGYRQIQQYYGTNGITDYTKPSFKLIDSILNKSNLNGAGRATTYSNNNKNTKTTIIGDVINHGKAKYWLPGQDIHYHATLQAGENTLEVSLARVLMKTLIKSNKNNNNNNIKEQFQKDYVKFMTTPESHNDTYASTCHRMFFVNYFHKKLPLSQCPDNDQHNVDTIDGLVLPTIAALAIAGQPTGTQEQASIIASNIASATRESKTLQQYAYIWGSFIYNIIRNDNSTIEEEAIKMAQSLRLRTPKSKSTNEITACYLNSAVPAMLDFLVKYNNNRDYSTIWDTLLANANTGGENVHRGSCIGAILGASADETTINDFTSSHLVQGLYHKHELENEIEQFIQHITNENNNNIAKDTTTTEI